MSYFLQYPYLRRLEYPYSRWPQIPHEEVLLRRDKLGHKPTVFFDTCTLPSLRTSIHHTSTSLNSSEVQSFRYELPTRSAGAPTTGSSPKCFNCSRNLAKVSARPTNYSSPSEKARRSPAPGTFYRRCKLFGEASKNHSQEQTQRTTPSKLGISTARPPLLSKTGNKVCSHPSLRTIA